MARTKRPQPPRVRLSYRGEPLSAQVGQTAAAALVGHGVDAWRSTRRSGRPRGLFCGIGVCFDCLLTIDGVPNQRACLVEVADGMRLGDESQAATRHDTAATGDGIPEEAR